MNFLTTSFVLAFVCLCAFNVDRAHGAVYTECGGVVKFGPEGTEPTVISYKEDVIYASEERCIWALVPEDPSIVYSKLNITFERSGLTHSLSDGFYFYTWTDSGLFEGSTIWAYQLDSSIFETSQGFLFFSSDYYALYTGFRILVSGIVSEDGSSKVDDRVVVHSKQFVDQSLADCDCACLGKPDKENLKIVYPEFPQVSYNNNVKFAAVFQHNYTSFGGTKNVTVDYLDSEQNIDVLEVYNLRPFTYRDVTFTRVGAFSGHHAEGFESSSTYESTIVLFRSDHADTGRGFQVRWF